MATTETVGSSVEQIPYVALEELGKIFFEGQNKYGVGNWKDNPSPSYRLERLRHAIRHLFLFAEHDTSEKHLAKVLWFCVTELFLESKYGTLRSFSSRELYPDAKHKEPIPMGVSMETGQVVFDTDIDKSMPSGTKLHREPVRAGRYMVNDGTRRAVNITEEKAKELNATNPLKPNPNPQMIEFGKYQLLQAEFEAYKIYAQREFKILHETIERVTSQQPEFHG